MKTINAARIAVSIDLASLASQQDAAGISEIVSQTGLPVVWSVHGPSQFSWVADEGNDFALSIDRNEGLGKATLTKQLICRLEEGHEAGRPYHSVITPNVASLGYLDPLKALGVSVIGESEVHDRSGRAKALRSGLTALRPACSLPDDEHWAGAYGGGFAARTAVKRALIKQGPVYLHIDASKITEENEPSIQRTLQFAAKRVRHGQLSAFTFSEIAAIRATKRQEPMRSILRVA